MYCKKLIGAKCYLSPISPNDAEPFTRWMNDLEVTQYLSTVSKQISYPGEVQFIADMQRTGSPIFSIVDTATDTVIGNCSLMGVDNVNHNAEVGIVIGEKSYLSKGYGTEAMSLLLDYGFNILNLQSIMLRVYEQNKRAIRSYEKVGFKRFGVRRKSRCIAGEYQGTVYMDILAEEFTSPFVKKTVAGA
ncbi:MAG: GNAT family N-acetyltransferase [Spirochaetes bacterium]|nr:GNAT family N-acetyltransferase [Spirochaetota bacterium]